MTSLYDVVTKAASEAVAVAVHERSNDPLDPVRVWDGAHDVWLVYEDYPNGRVETALSLRPVNIKMLGQEESAQEFLFTVGSRAWREGEKQAFWSAPGRYTMAVEYGASEEDLRQWLVSSVSRALERASRELYPLAAVNEEGVVSHGENTPRPVKPSEATNRAISKRKPTKSATARKEPTKAAAGKKAVAAKVPAKRAAPAKSAAAKKATAKKGATKKATAKKGAAKTTATDSSAKSTAAKKVNPKRSPARAGSRGNE